MRERFAEEIFIFFEKYINNNPELNDISKYYVQFMFSDPVSFFLKDKNGDINFGSPRLSFDSYWFDKEKPSNKRLQDDGPTAAPASEP